MTFRTISHRLALQFTGFVFLLLMINGAIFLVADLHAARNAARERLAAALPPIERDLTDIVTGRPGNPLPSRFRERLRIISLDGNTKFRGTLFEGSPPPFDTEAGSMRIDEEEYAVVTRPLRRNGTIVGYAQIIAQEEMRVRDLPRRIGVYIAVSFAISALTYGAGLLFARKSLRPAEEMLERLEQFTQDASHELRTPLMAVSTSIDLAMTEGNDPQQHLSQAKKDVGNMHRLIGTLLALARTDRAMPISTQHVLVAPIVRDVMRQHAALAATAEVTLHHAISDDVTVDADPTLLMQLLQNLVTNAVRFNRRGGRVDVRMDAHGVLTVADTGLGIAPEALPKIFDRFYQEDPVRTRPQEGAGLGLALVRRIVDLHGWTIDVKSTVGSGTTMRISMRQA